MKDRVNFKCLLPVRLAAALFVMLFAFTILPGTGFAQETEKTNKLKKIQSAIIALPEQAGSL